MKILGIETSCDETAMSVLEANKNNFRLLSNSVLSQIKIHTPFGGVVPSLAKREHQKNIVPILKQALEQAKQLKSAKILISEKDKEKIKQILLREEILFESTIEFLSNYQKPKIDFIAVTSGPGLEIALWTGVNFAKAISYYWNIPIININHLEGHIYSNWLGPVKKKSQYSGFKFPILNLLVSGGHTMLILMKKHGDFKILGQTRDDAVGEAFDKVARMLDLGFPGGPLVSKKADEIKNIKSEIDLVLPRPMIHSDDFDFSFAGLKTAVLYAFKDLKDKYPLDDLQIKFCNEFQNAAVDVLVSKTIKAAKKYKAKTIMLSGGVSANQLLRKTLEQKTQELNLLYHQPEIEYTGDNGAMIALAGYFKRSKATKKISSIKANANYNLKSW